MLLRVEFSEYISIRVRILHHLSSFQVSRGRTPPVLEPVLACGACCHRLATPPLSLFLPAPPAPTRAALSSCSRRPSPRSFREPQRRCCCRFPPQYCRSSTSTSSAFASPLQHPLRWLRRPRASLGDKWISCKAKWMSGKRKTRMNHFTR